jgi:hypothetical protein
VASLTAHLLLAWLAAAPSAFLARHAHVPAPPPRILNVVRHKLKPGTSHSYETLETAIVSAYEQAHVQVFWIMLQSRSDATDIVYLNVADSLEQWDEMGARYRKAAAAHPELEKMSARLATFIDRSTSTLATRLEEVPFSSTAVDLQTMRALRLTVFEVSPGHEGRFVRAARRAASRTSPWLLYEANDSPTFILVAPMRATSHTKKAPAIPRHLQDLKGGPSATETGVYTVRPLMSHPPKGWKLR